ncbi:MAG: hypothetical protein JXR58_11490 [Bacteroidales bacterium]|nr:hypothetical protein [Bacteroidales bacterium]
MEDKITFYSDLSFTISKLSPGNKTEKQVFKLVEDFRNSEHFQKTIYHLVDLRNCNFLFGIEKLDTFLEPIMHYRNIGKILKGAYIVNTTKETAMIHLLQEKMPEYVYCSGRFFAFKHLDLGISYGRFLELIDN